MSMFERYRELRACTRCGHRYLAMGRRYKGGPRPKAGCCRPCRFIAQAEIQERQARANRRKANAAVGPRDRNVDRYLGRLLRAGISCAECGDPVVWDESEGAYRHPCDLSHAPGTEPDRGSHRVTETAP